MTGAEGGPPPAGRKRFVAAMICAGALALPGLGGADPLSTLTATPSPGHVTEARVLGLDPHLFTRIELAQISAEERLRDRRDRLRFILQMKDRRGELPPGFMQTEAPRIIRSIRGGGLRDR